MSTFEENVKSAQSYLSRFKNNITGHHIAGKAVLASDAKTYTNITPVDNTALGLSLLYISEPTRPY